MRFFGNQAQQRMQRTAHWLWPLLKEKPAYGYEGRMVAIDGATPEDLPSIESLARVQGATASHYIPLEAEAKLTALFADAGLATDRWDQFMGEEACLKACDAFVRDFRIPDGYRLHRVGPDTTETDLDNLSDTALACGVLPPAPPVLFGQTQNAVCFFLEAPDGGVAACAGAVLRNHRASRFGTASWWGMLATREADRGQSLSLYLGARAALYMHEIFGAESFYTGVRRDNAVSRHVCAKLGVVESGYACLAMLDPDVFGEGGYTK